uniref:PH domain-containing protein n=1 Tax=Anopheles merus TaxID=30066 RepID=A0A182UTM8_ANOME
MKKFMTTTKTPAAVATVAGSSPSPPATFACETMPLQGAVRNGSPASGERTEDPATSGPPPTPTPTSTATGQPGAPLDETLATAQGAANGKGSSSLGRAGAPSTVGDTASTSTSSSTGVVKMCGYLKKKRNKMGGWRKLFFILQNQLLLSYSSRDDYEKKLAPFKDIINLVPGTIIIPTTGPRFTIETNSKLMYTFRCDDHRSCSEWIMALLDSLTVANGGHGTDRNFSLHNGLHRSTLPLTSYSLPALSCQPFAGPVGRLGGPTLALKKRAPQPPLVRSGPPKPPRIFPDPEVHESNDEDDLNNNHVLSGSLTGLDSPSKSRAASAQMTSRGGDEGDSGRPESAAGESSAPAAETKGADRFDGVDEEGVVAPAAPRRSRPEGEEEGLVRAARPRQQIFRLHQDVWSKAHRQSMDVCRINSMFSERQPALTLDGTARSASSAGVSFPAVACEAHLYEDVGGPCPALEPEPIYAVVDVRAKRSRRLARTLNPTTATPDGSERSDGGGGGNRKVSVSLPQISDGVELATVTERRPVTARSCSNYDDYEDVNYLFVSAQQRRPAAGTETDSVGTDGSREQLAARHESYGEEHIYEPILVAERIPTVPTSGSSSSLPAPATDQQHHHRSLWRHLKRMHLQGSWRRLTHRHASGSPKPDLDGRSTTATALEGLGRRLDSHRRSIKKRIKNLCERIDPVGTSASATSHHQPEGGDEPDATAATEQIAESSSGVGSRKSVSLDSFLLATGQQQASVPSLQPSST